MTEQIVVGTDGSPDAAVAVAWAAGDAERKGARLHVVHVVDYARYSTPRFSSMNLQDELTKAGQALLEHTAMDVRDNRPGLAVTTQLAVGHPVAELSVLSEDAAELVVGTRGLNALAGAVLGSVSLGVVSHARGVVVVAREAPPVGDEVVVGVDASEASRPALAHAFTEAARRRVPLRVVHAWQVPVHFISFDRDAALQAQTRALRDLVAPWRAERPDVEVIEDLVCAPPIIALVTAAKRAGLLVVGSRGRGGVKSAALLGSVSHGVLHRARCPVAVVR
ncbi:universal stress protein [Nonomuraea sp. NPDC003804]|uniref:universal stress protein n=1 Tax=Nonomuraea sp. NPDC003804 TaxID=3154547 RepID=UPI0033B5DA07